MAGVFTFEFKINEKKKKTWTNKNVYNQQKVQPPRLGQESAQGYIWQTHHISYYPGDVHLGTRGTKSAL